MQDEGHRALALNDTYLTCSSLCEYSVFTVAVHVSTVKVRHYMYFGSLWRKVTDFLFVSVCETKKGTSTLLL